MPTGKAVLHLGLPGKAVLGLYQAPLEIPRFDRPRKGVDDRRDPARLAFERRLRGARRVVCGNQLAGRRDCPGVFGESQSDIAISSRPQPISTAANVELCNCNTAI